MKVAHLSAMTFLSYALTLTPIGYVHSHPMQQVEIDQVEPLQTLSSFDGYQFGHNFGPEGVYSFYYLLPTSSRKEQRTPSGEVTGEYAFVAPEGNEFEFRYNAGDEGFQVDSDALPQPPEDTDEVKKAKEEFFAAFQKALEMAESLESDEDSSSEESDEDEDSEESEESDEEESEEESEEDEEGEQKEESRLFPVVFRPVGFGRKLQSSYPNPYSR